MRKNQRAGGGHFLRDSGSFNRSVQLMTELKCGTRANPGAVLALNKLRIRGILR